MKKLLFLFTLFAASPALAESYYAELDKNNIVVRVIPGVEGGEAIYSATTGTVWKQTSIDTHGGINPNGAPFRKNYAGIGYKFDPSVLPDGAFIPPKPYPSWTLDSESCLWQAPVPYPQDGKLYIWDEATLSWKLG